MVITSQTCHTLQIFFRLFPRRITTRFAVPLLKSVGVLCFLCIYREYFMESAGVRYLRTSC